MDKTEFSKTVNQYDQRIRVMHVVWTLGLAGMEYNVIKVVNGLDLRCFQPSICCLTTARRAGLEALSENVKVFELDKKPGFQPRLFIQLAQILKSEKIDIVHSHNWTTFLYTVVAARLAGVGGIVHGEHGRDTAEYEKGKRVQICRWLASKCDVIVAVSPDIVKIIREVWRVEDSRVCLIPNGVDTGRFGFGLRGERVRKELNIPEGAIVIGTVIGMLREVKDIETLLKAYRYIFYRRPDVFLTIVGYGPYGARCEALARELGVIDRTRFLGLRQDIPEVVGSLDVYVNSSVYEGMSNTLLEAMAVGKPVVATAVGGTPNIVTDGKTGLLVPPRRPELLGKKILGLLVSPDDVKHAMVKAAREYVEKHHKMETMISKNVMVYRRIAAKRKLKLAEKIKRRLKIISGNFFHYMGLLYLSVKVNRPKIKVINYHRVLPQQCSWHVTPQAMVVDSSTFEAQLRFFKSHCSILRLSEAVSILSSSSRIPKPFVSLTFDDGFRSVYDVVFPAIKKYRIPICVFLTTEAIGNDNYLWWDKVGEKLKAFEFDGWMPPEDWPADIRQLLDRLQKTGPYSREYLVEKIIYRLNRCEAATRDRIISILRGVPVPMSSSVEGHMLSWGMVKEMAISGLVDFGAHGATHRFLDELSTQELEWEIRTSKEMIETQIGKPVLFFSFPGGRYNPKVLEAVKRAGFQAAFSTTYGGNDSRQNLFALNRIDAKYLTLGGRHHSTYSQAVLAGLHSIIRPG